MKRLILLTFLSVIILSCDKEDEIPISTYQVVNNMEADFDPTIEYLDGTLYEVVVFCFDETGDVVMEHDFAPIAPGGGMSEKKEVPDYVEKVVVSFKFLPPESNFYDMETNQRRYTVTRFVITPGENKMIEISGSTYLQKTLTKSAEQKMINAILNDGLES